MDQPAVVASSLSRRPAGHVADQLSRESEIVSLSSYFFDSIFYEANESSSACRLGLNLKSKPVRPHIQTTEGITLSTYWRLKANGLEISRLEVWGLLRFIKGTCGFPGELNMRSER